MIKKGEYVKAFRCNSDSLYIFRMEKFDKNGVYFGVGEKEYLFEWQFVTKLSKEEMNVLGLEG